MISFKDHSLALFGVWYQGVMFAQERMIILSCRYIKYVRYIIIDRT